MKSSIFDYDTLRRGGRNVYEKRIAELESLLKQQNAELEKQTKVLEKVAKAPHQFGVILRIDTDRVVLSNGGIVSVPKECLQVDVKVGDQVRIDPQTNMVVAKDSAPQYGGVARVTDVLADNRLLVDDNGTQNDIVATDGVEFKVGDTVRLDSTRNVALGVVPRTKTSLEQSRTTGITWDDIGGNDGAKLEMIEAIEHPRLYSNVFAAYGKKPVKGIVLYGPAGCGKTMLAKAAATAVNNGAGNGFIYVKGPEVLSKWVGEAEATIRSLFQAARAYKAEHNTPAVIFIDEAEALLSHRTGRQAMMEKTIVPTFLAEMDGLDDTGALVILATNYVENLDPAVVREGRMDRKIKVSRPTHADALDILQRGLSKTVLAKSLSAADAAKIAADAFYSPQLTMYHVETDEAVVAVTISNIASGAMLAGIVEQSATHAMRRDFASKAKKPTGVCKVDIEYAVKAVFDMNKDVSHTEALAELLRGADIKGIKRYAQ
jgi:proteasome-associated ATPase